MSHMSARQRATLVLLLGAQFLIAVDFSVLNVALPVVGRGLGFAVGDLQWIATAFALCAAGFTLLFGRVGDLVGRRRLFLVGLAVLGAGSLAGGLAVDPAMLLAARVAQGLATAAVTPAALSLVTTAFPEGPPRSRALGLGGALMSAGFTAGAILGGLLTDLLSWRWAFFLNVPVVAVILALAPALLPAARRVVGTRLDVPGAVTVTGGLLALVYGLTAAGEHGFAAPSAVVGLVSGVLLLAVFWAVERRSAAPLVPVRVLRRGTVVRGNLAGLVAFATETSLVFLLTLYLQQILGYSPLATGLSFGVLGAGTVTGGILGPRVLARLGASRALVAGFAAQAAATLPLAFLTPGHGWLVPLLAATFVGGVGNMVAIVGFMVTATTGLPDTDQGLATALATMTQQIGITLGIPVLSAVVTAFAGAGLLPGIRVAVAVNVAAVALAAVLLAVRRGSAGLRGGAGGGGREAGEQAGGRRVGRLGPAVDQRAAGPAGQQVGGRQGAFGQRGEG
jgi:MFS family permease